MLSNISFACRNMRLMKKMQYTNSAVASCLGRGEISQKKKLNYYIYLTDYEDLTISLHLLDLIISIFMRGPQNISANSQR